MAIKFKGDTTVAIINSIKKAEVDTVYRCFDSGVLLSNEVINHGDFVSWDGTKWIKRSDLSYLLDNAEHPIGSQIEAIQAVIPEGTTGGNPLVNEASLGIVAGRVTTAEGDIDAIEGKIPSGASSSNKLVTSSELDAAQDSWQSGFTPKGEATVSQINSLTTQRNGDQYIVTDSGTITAGSVAVVAGDTVSWSDTDEVWYKVPQYAKAVDITIINSKIPFDTSETNKLVNRSELEAYVKEFFGPYYVIGGRLYRCVKIDGKIWMAENLDFKFPGLAIGSWSSAPSAGYYNNDEAQYGIDGNKKCGLLYNWYAAKYLEDNKATLIPGWHVPTADEISALISAVGVNAGTKLKALDNSVDSGTWPTAWAGSDNFGFAVLPSGNYSNGFSNIGVYANIWSSSSNDESSAWRRNFSSAATTAATSSPKIFGFSIRLVKD